MYIPTIFLGTNGTCLTVDISGSVLPLGVSLGTLQSGSESYFYIKCESSVYFDIATGVTENAKLLVVGGGGYGATYPGFDRVSGGGAAGTVVWKDIPMQPGKYFLSASLGGQSGSVTAGNSIFRANAEQTDPVNWYEEVGYGGSENDRMTGGSNPQYSGGLGRSGSLGAGGGGAGSTGNGQSVYLSGGSFVGGNGGSGSIIPTPFNSVVGYSIVAAGGAGEAFDGNDGDFVGQRNAWGNGGDFSGFASSPAGENGVVILFIPRTGCFYSGSGVPIPDETFFAEGGSTGTFISGSVQYKYHNFTAPAGRSQFFKVRSGFTNEARILQIGAGAGSSTQPYLGTGSVYGGGAGAGGLVINSNVSLAGLNNLVTVGAGGVARLNGNVTTINGIDTNFVNIQALGGGAGGVYNGNDTFSTSSRVGGSGGGGADRLDGGIGASGTPGQGFAGGNAATVVSLNGSGGGGGATGVGFSTTGSFDTAAGGPGYELTGFWSYLTSSVFTANPFIAKGGGGGIGASMFTQGRKLNNNQAYDGSGADPFDNVSGSAGFLSIVYPISGSISNSLA